MTSSSLASSNTWQGALASITVTQSLIAWSVWGLFGVVMVSYPVGWVIVCENNEDDNNE